MLNVKQIPPSVGYYLAGFADGEGSFNINFSKRDDYKTSWKVTLCFNISQKDPVILSLFKKYLKCGTMRKRKDGIWYYEVNNLSSIVNNVIPFFEKFGFLSSEKKKDFSKFKQIARIIMNDEHLSSEGIKKILMIWKDMSGGGKMKNNEEEIQILL